MPHFSPDGGALAFYANGRLLRVALDGGQPQPIAETSQMSGLTWSPSGQLVLGLNGGLATVAAAGGPIRPWTAPDTTRGETFQQFPVALADGEHVLYSSWGGGGIETVRIGVASLPSGRTRILDVTGTAALGVVDGWLVFATTAGALMAVQVELESGIVRGTPVTLLNGLLVGSGGGPRATLSHSGSLVYMGGSRESTLALVDAAGKLTPLLPEVRPYGYPRYSPDGSRIAYSLVGAAGSDIYVYDLASRTPTRLRTGGAINERPEWSADGERILFRTDQAVRTAIWWMPVDQSGPPEPLISSPREAAFEAVMTPDGKYLVFQEDTIGADVWYRALSPDSAPRPIATSRSIENMARVSPNGRWVAFVTDASGLNQVVVQPFPGPGARVQVSSAGGAEPVWARDGRRIFYRANQKLMVATVSTESGFRVTGRSVFADDLFMSAQSPHANFDVTPDGQRLLVLKGQLDPRLIVVHNWAAELRARVAGARP